MSYHWTNGARFCLPNVSDFAGIPTPSESIHHIVHRRTQRESGSGVVCGVCCAGVAVVVAPSQSHHHTSIGHDDTIKVYGTVAPKQLSLYPTTTPKYRGFLYDQIKHRGMVEQHQISINDTTYTYSTAEPWRDEDLLFTLYHRELMSTTEIGSAVGCSAKTVWKWLKRHNIETRDRGDPQPYVSHAYTHEGYEAWKPHDPNTTVLVHRLLAVAEHGFDAVCDRDVHHVNKMPGDNRPANIQLLTSAEHARLHATTSDAVVDGDD